MVSRNTSCHYGSGKKFEKCCMNAAQVPLVSGFGSGEQVFVGFLENDSKGKAGILSVDHSSDQGYVRLLDLGISYRHYLQSVNPVKRCAKAAQVYLDARAKD